jgi:hypothetical protein
MQQLIKLMFLILLVASGCHNNSILKSEAKAESKIDTAAFMSSFKNMAFDSLSVSSEYDSFSNKNYYLTGVPLDTSYKVLFPDSFTDLPQHFMSSIDQVYAVGRFDLDEGYEAFLLRHPGEYSASQITLFIFDKKNRRFAPDNLMLAESFGDAGDIYLLQGELKKGDKGRLTIYLDEETNMTGHIDTTSDLLLYRDSLKTFQSAGGRIIRESASESKRWYEKDPIASPASQETDSTDSEK